MPMEGCALGDLVTLAVPPADAGPGDYDDDVEAIVRNHPVEGEPVDPDFLRRVVRVSVGREPPEFRPARRAVTE
jgi:hypothetical protein